MSTVAILNQSEPNVILTAHATKVTELNQTEPNRKRVWPVKITPVMVAGTRYCIHLSTNRHENT